MLLTLEEKVDPQHAALLIVDVQNDFCHSQGLLGRRNTDMSAIQAMVPRLRAFLEEARGAGVMVIHIRMAQNFFTKSEAMLEHRLRRHGDSQVACEEGTWGAEFYQVQPQPGEPIVTKHRYSAFIDTDLERILQSRGVKTLILSGVATNVCVESTARDGFMRDYYSVFLEDCTACGDPQLHQGALDNMRRSFGTVVTCAEVAAAWMRLKERVPATRE